MISVAQLGARMHYAVPRILANYDMLQTLYTDFYGDKSPFKYADQWPLNKISQFQKMATRNHSDLKKSAIKHYPMFGIMYPKKRNKCITIEDKYQHFVNGGQQFANMVVKSIDSNKPKAIYTFNSAGLELMKWAKLNEVIIIHEQCSSLHSIEKSLVANEQNKYEEWGVNFKYGKWSSYFADREEEELSMANYIVCGSDFVNFGIKKKFGSIKSIFTVPYGVEMQQTELRPFKYKSKRPLNVLTVGNINIQKGSQYVLETAKALKGFSNFRMVGDYSRVPNNIVTELKKYVDLTGIVDRNKVDKHYQWADIFLLPSICEGSATVTYEALQYGLPMIVTANTGSIIENGKEGFIVPVSNSESIINCLNILNDDGIRMSMSKNAITTSTVASFSAYGDRLMSLINLAL